MYNEQQARIGDLPLGIVLVAAGFVVAAVAGLWLASQISQVTVQVSDVALKAILIFFPAAALVVSGLYVRLRQRWGVEAPSSVAKQRELVDLLNQRRQMSVQEMTAALGTDEATVRELVEQLVRLDVFSGYVDWNAGILYASRHVESIPSEDRSG